MKLYRELNLWSKNRKMRKKTLITAIAIVGIVILFWLSGRGILAVKAKFAKTEILLVGNADG